MADLPTGTVTFLLTDVEGSTRLWEDYPAPMQAATARHDALVEEAVARHGGVVVRPRGEGDSRFAVFARASDAVGAAAAMQVALQGETWPTPRPLRIRMALHTGEADLRDGDYYGAAVNRCARLRAIAHGGQTLLSQTTCDLVRHALPDRVGLRDLGEHRLADLTLPEHVFQVLYPALPADFPPLRSLDVYAHNLPLQPTSFVGREREIADIEEAIASSRLVTLTGTGGCGKTRLALQVASGLLDRFSDGVWFVDLAPLSDPGLVPQAVAAVLGIREDPSRPLLATIAEYLRGRSLLLLLDNCEHLIDACAHLADTLLQGCPGVCLLATSREILGVRGEAVRRVPSLIVPDAAQPPSPEELSRYEAVRLFVERARTVVPTFAVTGQNAAAVIQICRRLDGIPLAIELAAARARVLTVEQIAARLDDRFRLLTGGSRTVLRRQQTLRALIDWSHDLLSRKEQALFRRLAVFAGGWTLESAEAACPDPLAPADLKTEGRSDPETRLPASPRSVAPPAGDNVPSVEGPKGQVRVEEVLDLLTGLVDKSLVVVEGAGKATRYRFLDTIGAYALERLIEASEAASCRARHLAWCLALAERAEPELLGPGQVAWLGELEAEGTNLRAALDWGLASDPQTALRLAGALWRFWYIGSPRFEGIHWLEAALPRASGRSMDRARALLGLAFSTREGGEHRRVRALTEESLSLFRELGDRREIAWALNNLCILIFWEGDYGRAKDMAEESLALFQAIDDRAGIGMGLRELGYAMVRQETEEEGRRRGRKLLEQSLQLLREIGDCWNLGWTLRHLGYLARLDGENEPARAMFEESLGLFRRIGNPGGTAMALFDLASLAVWESDFGRARRILAPGIALAREVGHAFGVAQCLLSFGTLWVRRGEPARGVRLISAAVGLQPLTSSYPNQHVEYEAGLAAARNALGDQAFAAAWAEGQEMTLDQAIDDALDEGR